MKRARQLLQLVWINVFVLAAYSAGCAQPLPLNFVYTGSGSQSDALKFSYETGFFRKRGLDLTMLYVTSGVITFLPLWAAQDTNIFKKHDLTVELIAVGSSTRGIARRSGTDQSQSQGCESGKFYRWQSGQGSFDFGLCRSTLSVKSPVKLTVRPGYWFERSVIVWPSILCVIF